MPFEELIRDIQAQEHWLEGLDVEVAPPPGALDRTRERLHLAIEEAWLAERAFAVPAPGVITAVKQAVAEELAAASEGPVPDGLEGNRILRLFTSVSAVASLLLAAGLGFWSGIAAPDRAQPSTVLADLVEVMSRQPDDEETEWAAIDAELAALETTLARGATSAWAGSLLDDLEEDIDLLIFDGDLSLDSAEGAG